MALSDRNYELSDEEFQVIGKSLIDKSASLARQFIELAKHTDAQPVTTVMAGILAAISLSGGMVASGRLSGADANMLVREILTLGLARAGIPMTGISAPRKQANGVSSTDMPQLLTDVAATLIDLGACNDADCPDCAHVLTRVQAALAEMTAPAHG